MHESIFMSISSGSIERSDLIWGDQQLDVYKRCYSLKDISDVLK